MLSKLKRTGLVALALTVSAGMFSAVLTPAASANGMASNAGVKVATKKIVIDDLDLTRDNDLRRLDGRIRAAAAAVCKDADNAGSCEAAAKRGATAQVAKLRKLAIDNELAGFPTRIATSLVVSGG